MGTGTAAARELALSSPTPAPPGTRSTPSAGLMETGAQALSLNVEIRELHLVQVLQPRNLERGQERNQGRSPLRENQERNQGRSLGRSQERSQGRSQERNQERNQERSPERSQERSQARERNQTKAEQCLLLNVIMWMQTIYFHWPNNNL